jgi:hypothetical protein
MKSITCRQLGGACDLQFKGDTFDEIAKQSKVHAMEMYQQADEAHMKAMQEMQSMMTDPSAMKNWMEEKKRMFDELPETN